MSASVGIVHRLKNHAFRRQFRESHVPPSRWADPAAIPGLSREKFISDPAIRLTMFGNGPTNGYTDSLGSLIIVRVGQTESRELTVDYDFEESVGYWLTRTTQAYHRAFSDAIEPFGITFRQAQVLCWVMLEEKMTVAELANKMMIEPPTLVGILDRMERSEWISRTSCEDDRRRKWIRVTPAAAPVWKKIAACGVDMRRRATEGISERQLKSLKKLLDTIDENVSAKVPAES